MPNLENLTNLASAAVDATPPPAETGGAGVIAQPAVPQSATGEAGEANTNSFEDKLSDLFHTVRGDWHNVENPKTLSPGEVAQVLGNITNPTGPERALQELVGGYQEAKKNGNAAEFVQKDGKEGLDETFNRYALRENHYIQEQQDAADSWSQKIEQQLAAAAKDDPQYQQVLEDFRTAYQEDGYRVGENCQKLFPRFPKDLQLFSSADATASSFTIDSKTLGPIKA